MEIYFQGYIICRFVTMVNFFNQQLICLMNKVYKLFIPLSFLFFIVSLTQANAQIINVRIYAGSNFFKNPQWNNWNIGSASTSKASTALRYIDGSLSTVTAVISNQTALSNNGASYGLGSIMCPDSVLQFCSYYTGKRTLTIKGLDNTAMYNIELYSSRNRTDGQKTVFTINGMSKTINTDRNFSYAAIFSSVMPQNGQLIIQLANTGLYNYLNGFKLIKIKNGQNAIIPPKTNAGQAQTVNLPSNTVILNGTLNSGSNPVASVSWSQDSGPSTSLIKSPNSLSTVVSNLSNGVYTFRLTAIDVSKVSSFSTVTVTVKTANTKKVIGVIGSSTSGGYFSGMWPKDTSYIMQLQHYYHRLGLVDTIYNLFRTGSNIYNAMPSWYKPGPELQPSSTYTPDTTININKILKFHPDVIICHFPTNAYDYLTVPQVLFAVKTIKAKADSAGVPIFFVGTHPRGAWVLNNRKKLIDINDSLRREFAPITISYFDSVAISPHTPYMNPIFWLDGDSIHMNPKGHDIIFRQMVTKNILSAARVNAGLDKTIILPYNSVRLEGSASSSDGSLSSILWTQVRGPNTALIDHPSSLNILASNLIAGTYIFKLSATDKSGFTASSLVSVFVKLLPKVNAGGNHSFTFPIYSLNLEGSAEKGNGGPIRSIRWMQMSGPAAVVFSAPNSLVTSVSGLALGQFKLKLIVTDSAGNTGVDTSIILVSGTIKDLPVNVRLYDGAGAYKNKQWNNWNLTSTAFSNLSSGTLNYSDGTQSPITAILSNQTALADNGAGYALSSSMCPDSVLRYSSYSTNTRTLTIKGLDNSTAYTIQLFASRNKTDGQKTIFKVNGQSVVVLTDQNISNTAMFSSVKPVNGIITVTLASNTTYNYLNGFRIYNTLSAGSITALSNPGTESMANKVLDVLVYPNPVKETLFIINNENATLQVELYDMMERRVMLERINSSNNNIDLRKIAPGNYFLRIENKNNGRFYHKLIVKN